ncbi:LysR substrate-binding domain-containing protein, partial [Hydrogenibacillus schlegelii]|uniref:LysR substrate-binding domain-containing protein n=1 Tax=Hydrogenibacillus schlegelii TaxID=1484 RepID=UPI0034A03519
GESVLPRLIGGFARRYPRVDIEVTVGNTEEIVEKVAVGALDGAKEGRRVRRRKRNPFRPGRPEVADVAGPVVPVRRPARRMPPKRRSGRTTAPLTMLVVFGWWTRFRV